MSLISLYTDGASSGNPGPGGYAVVLKYKHYRKEFYQGFRKTTNNRMELLAVIVGLEALKKVGSQVIIYSDSKYVVDPINKGWLLSWVKKKFKGKKNPDLWERFWQVYQQHQVTLQWVKGHAGNAENEHCDKVAVKSIKNKTLAIDYAYEKIQCPA